MNSHESLTQSRSPSELSTRGVDRTFSGEKSAEPPLPWFTESYFSRDPKTAAALKFARCVLDTRGAVGDEDLQEVRSAGYDDGEIVELVAAVVLGCFTNFLNNVADTEPDVSAA